MVTRIGTGDCRNETGRISSPDNRRYLGHRQCDGNAVCDRGSSSSHFGKIDILFNNAGVFHPKNIPDCTEDEWDDYAGGG